MMKRMIIGVVILSLLAGAGYALFGRDAATTDSSASQPTTVLTEPENQVVAEAHVVPIRSATLGLPIGGTIAALLVQEGVQVAADQVLVRLDAAPQAALVVQAEAVLAEAQARYEQLRSGATSEEIAVAEAQLEQARAQLQQTSGSVTATDLQAAEAQLQQAQAQLSQLQAGPKEPDVRSTQAQLGQAQANLSTQRDSLSATKTNAELKLQQAVSALTQAQSAYSTAFQNWQYVQDTGKDPLNSTVDPKTGKRAHVKLNDPQRQQYYDAYIQAQAALRSAESAVQQAQVAYDTARQNEVSGVQVAEQGVTTAQANLDKLMAGSDPDVLASARAQVAAARANLDKLQGDQRSGALGAARAGVAQAQANLDLLRAGASENSLAVALAQLQRAQAEVKVAQVALQQTELRAPFAGVVSVLDLNVGEFVAPGTPIVRLADFSAWQIETTDLTELNVVDIRVGAPVTMTFDALPGLDLPGTVARVESFGENKQGDITYTVAITPDQQDKRLRWNMTASVSIETTVNP
jgi:HlyD family secretion protein